MRVREGWAGGWRAERPTLCRVSGSGQRQAARSQLGTYTCTRDLTPLPRGRPRLGLQPESQQHREGGRGLLPCAARLPHGSHCQCRLHHPPHGRAGVPRLVRGPVLSAGGCCRCQQQVAPAAGARCWRVGLLSVGSARQMRPVACSAKINCSQRLPALLQGHVPLRPRLLPPACRRPRCQR